MRTISQGLDDASVDKTNKEEGFNNIIIKWHVRGRQVETQTTRYTHAYKQTGKQKTFLFKVFFPVKQVLVPKKETAKPTNHYRMKQNMFKLQQNSQQKQLETNVDQLVKQNYYMVHIIILHTQHTSTAFRTLFNVKHNLLTIFHFLIKQEGIFRCIES